MALPATTERVSIHTDAQRNRKIMIEMEHRLWYYVDHPEEIDARLRELDREWDTERTLELNASVLALAGSVLAGVLNRAFVLVPVVVTGFLLQHALQGWCPPVPVLRRIGIRTQSEIELERYSLKALRGDFGELGKPEADQSPEGRRRYPRKVLEAMQDRPWVFMGEGV